ncbi:spore germination protein GerM [Barrientosiimonas marina]|uniref:GerMN domain-containing protein n=1 Tax=Lentibacillus kimchii TaxID=1542911 RepID=A0ABW2V0Y8_9BACI
MLKRTLLPLSLAVLMMIILTGCFQGEQSLDNEEMDPPPDAEATDDKKEKTDEGESDENKDGEGKEKKSENQDNKTSETVERQLYLFDANGMVAPQKLEIPEPDSKAVAEQSLEYLVKDGPVTSLLPNGFEAVLPAGTEILGLNLEENGTMIVDVSKEFENYKAEDELEVLEAMTYTLTQYDTVDEMKLRIDGNPQESMPVDGTPIADGYSRANGINLVQNGTVDLLGSESVTLYYPSAQGDNKYFVPVTEHINVDSDHVYESAVQALMQGPAMDTNLQHVFNQSVELTSHPELDDDGVLEMVFNQEVLEDNDDAIISNDVMGTLVRTLTQDKEIEAIDVKVEDVETLFNENGKAYTEPVTVQSFTGIEKL